MASTDTLRLLLERSTPEKHPLFSFQWVCVSIGVNNDIQINPNYVDSLDLPFSNTSIGQGWFGAATFTYFPDFSNISDVSITFVENSSCEIQQAIWKWKNAVCDLVNGTGVYNLPKEYKGNAVFKLQAVDGTDVMEVTLTGIWPADTSAFSLSYTSSDIVKVTQQFSVDGQVINFPKNSLKSGLSATSSEKLLETRSTRLSFGPAFVYS